MGPLKRLAKKLALSRNVKFFGFVEEFDEVAALMKSSKIFVIPSTQEGGASIVTLEANACGLPVIAVNHPLGIDKRLIRNGLNGFFAGFSPESLAERIRSLLQDEELRRKMGRNATEFAKGYDWDKIVEILEKVYKGL